MALDAVLAGHGEGQLGALGLGELDDAFLAGDDRVGFVDEVGEALRYGLRGDAGHGSAPRSFGWEGAPDGGSQPGPDVGVVGDEADDESGPADGEDLQEGDHG